MKCPKCNSELEKLDEFKDGSCLVGCGNEECDYTVCINSEGNIEMPVGEEKEYPVEDEESEDED